jgi:4a-hydroxytetrahydrobiopterin dehydratase
MEVKDFHAAEGVGDWRILGNGAHARYRCASLAEAAAFAAEIARAAEVLPRPHLDLRDGSISIRLPAHEAEEMWVDDDDLAAARWIQSRARALGMTPDPGSLRQVQFAVAHAPEVEVRGFWRAVLGYEPLGDEDARDPDERNPRLWFHELRGGGSGRGRTHLDVYVPAESAEAIVAAAVAAGGRIADASNAPHWWSLASPDNHGVDIAPWPDRG